MYDATVANYHRILGCHGSHTIHLNLIIQIESIAQLATHVLADLDKLTCARSLGMGIAGSDAAVVVVVKVEQECHVVGVANGLQSKETTW